MTEKKKSPSSSTKNATTEEKASPTKSTLAEMDIADLKIAQNFHELAGVRSILSAVPVGTPPKDDFVRVVPDPNYQMSAGVLHLKSEGVRYLVAPALHQQLGDEVRAVLIVTFITRGGVVGLWPLGLPDATGRTNPWHESAHRIAATARDSWVRVRSNMALGGYEAFTPVAPMEEPEWPAHTFKELVTIAFGDRFIDTMDHPVVKRLRGAI